MDKIKRFFLTSNPLKVVSVVILGIVALMFIVWLLGFVARSVSFNTGIPAPFSMPGVTFGVADYDAVSFGKGGGVSVSMPSVGMAELSARNVMGMPVPPQYYYGTVGDDAEEFEATDYSGYFETGNLERLCGSIEDLKSESYVVFENASKNDKTCDYTFKVEKARVEGVLSILESLDPKYLTENTRTIKPTLDDFTGAQEILTKKLEAIEETLEEAQTSYDQLRVLATSARDAESLAKVIESKINLIERLTMERLSLRSELDRLARDKALQVDKLEYVYFSLSVFEKRIVDLEAIKDSWISELQRFAREINQLLQSLTLGVLTLILYVALAAVYVVILVLIAKYGWRLVKHLWRF